MKLQRVRTPFLENWDQVSLETLSFQATLGLQLEGLGESKTLALTFDDGPSVYTRSILRILEKSKIKATFFMLGKSVEKYPEIARLVLRKGHSLGNHTYDHQRADRFNYHKLLIKQLLKTKKIFRRKLRCDTNLYRPAYGAISNTQIAKVKCYGYNCFAWSIDTQDWYFKNPYEIFGSVVNNLHNEAIVLMHDGGGKTRKNTVSALQLIIDECLSQGYKFVTLDQYVAKK